MTERRWDPTAGEWVSFATDRQDRTYHPDPSACPLCPTRPGGPLTEIPRPAYQIAVFDNRFPALRQDPPAPSVAGTALTPVEPAYGHCEVVVYTDCHDATLAQVGIARIRLLVEVWADRTKALGSTPGIGYVLPFENKGEIIGVTLSHPHGQIYAYPDIPPRPRRQLEQARAHHRQHGTCVWCDLVTQEAGLPNRVVVDSRHFLAVVPFWARWPYQVEIWPRRHWPDLLASEPEERQDLAEVLAEVLAAYDALFGFSMPYILGVYQQPRHDTSWSDVSHTHIELDPPYRSATKLKYLAGSETIGGAFLTDVSPEEAAERLRAARKKASVPQ